ncbi:hypothetical protein VM98_36660, partial [Streptomyces rubellomurinus subsp. indigoferus]
MARLASRGRRPVAEGQLRAARAEDADRLLAVELAGQPAPAAAQAATRGLPGEDASVAVPAHPDLAALAEAVDRGATVTDAVLVPAAATDPEQPAPAAVRAAT